MPVDHYENFPVASLLLPRRLRRPVEAIYRFARAADDIADEGDASDAQRLQGLAEYRRGTRPYRTRRASGPGGLRGAGGDHPRVAPAGGSCSATCSTPLRRMSSPEALRGLPGASRLLPSLGQSGRPPAAASGRAARRRNLHRSDCICSALQLVNFWQDIAIDWQKERVYLPQADLERFGIAESQIAAGCWSAAWAALLDFETERAPA
jgi:phytoene/squalene synthetase